MTCPYCGGETKVTDSRPRRENNMIYRRRECLVCGERETTYEMYGRVERKAEMSPIDLLELAGMRVEPSREKA